jgi:hypothetical protein
MLMQELFSRGIMKMGASRNDPSRQVGVFNREFVAKLPARGRGDRKILVDYRLVESRERSTRDLSKSLVHRYRLLEFLLKGQLDLYCCGRRPGNSPDHLRPF